MGWNKRKEPLAPQPAHKPLAMDVESIDVVPDDEPPPVEERQIEHGPIAAATIGATLRIQGELTGHEDLTIDGSIEGRVEVLEHTLTIGPSASIKASIRGRCVVIEGQVVGDVTADDKVEVTATGSLVGNIRAARVVLAENARFKGSVDMGWTESESPRKPIEAAKPPAPPRRPAKEEQSPPQQPRSAAPTVGGSKLSALDWDTPSPPPPTPSAPTPND